jgi:hypothetical protein
MSNGRAGAAEAVDRTSCGWKRLEALLFRVQRRSEVGDERVAFARNDSGGVSRQIAQRFGCDADALDPGERLLRLRHDRELIGEPLDLHVEQARRPLQVIDRPLGEQARLLDLAHGRIEVAQWIEPNEREYTAATLSLVAAPAGDRRKISKADLRHRP